MGGSIIAEQWVDEQAGDVTTFKLNDPLTGSMQQVNADGTFSPDNSEESEQYPNHNEMAGLGTSVPLTAPSPGSEPETHPGHGGTARDAQYGCFINGMEQSGFGPCTKLIGSVGFMVTVTKKHGWWVGKHSDLTSFAGKDITPYRVDTLNRWYPATTVTTISVTSWDFSSYSQQSIPQATGLKAGFNARDQKRYDEQRQEVRDSLNNISQKCLDFLTKAGLTVKDVLNAVNLQNAYEGEKSTISMSDAGYYKEGSLSEIPEKNRNGMLNQKMSDFIKRNAKAATMLYPGGAETNLVGSRSDVYFQINYSNGVFGLGKGYGENSGLNQTTILHEAIHSLTGLGDIKLYTLLTGKTADGDASSRGISQALKDNDCTK